eukprot:SAG11_NODE_12171_length_717_cov_3.658576_2_plen_71_part_00
MRVDVVAGVDLHATCGSCDELMLTELAFNNWYEVDSDDLPPNAGANDSRGSWDQRSEVLVAVMIMTARPY